MAKKELTKEEKIDFIENTIEKSWEVLKPINSFYVWYWAKRMYLSVNTKFEKIIKYADSIKDVSMPLFLQEDDIVENMYNLVYEAVKEA